MVDDGRTDDGRRTDGRTTEHGYTISSPCEPDGSGELKKIKLFPCLADLDLLQMLFFLLIYLFFIQLYIPFKIISAQMRHVN